LVVDHGLTQEGLAERSDFGVGFIQFVESGARNLTVDSLVALADAVDAPVEPFLHQVEARPPRRPNRPRTS
jgi:transcriptional regulator with XRE-family HTH domain